MMALLILVHTLPRRLSTTALRCLILLHLLWPAKGVSPDLTGLVRLAGLVAGRGARGYRLSIDAAREGRHRGLLVFVHGAALRTHRVEMGLDSLAHRIRHLVLG